MAWVKVLLVFSMIIVMCYCQCQVNPCHKKKKKYHYHDLLFKGGILYYYTFLILKIKAIFVFGTVFAIGLALGKFFAILKLAEYMKKKNHHDEHHDYHGDEKVVFMSPYGHGIPAYKSSGFADQGYPQPYQQYPSQAVYSNDQQAPPNTDIAGQNYGGGRGYARSNDQEDDGMYDKFKEFITMLQNSNTTELVFKEMNVGGNTCKRKLICELEFNAKQSLIIQAGLNMLSDPSYMQYKTNSTVDTVEDCQRLYPQCDDNWQETK